MKKLTIGIILLVVPTFVGAVQTTPYGKIVGIETRDWGLHVQTDFGFDKMGCLATVGALYMYDFHYGNTMNSSDKASVEVSLLFAAFAAQKDVSFHIYSCIEHGTRPLIGFIRVK